MHRSSCRCVGPCGGTLAASRSYVESVECATRLLVLGPWRVHTQAPAAPLDAGTCPVVALCVLRPASAWGVLLRQNPTASEISDARFRAIYSGMRKLPLELLGAAGLSGDPSVPQTIGRVPSLCVLSFSLESWSIWRGRVTPTSMVLHCRWPGVRLLVQVEGVCVS